jgi:hypothetical protein
MERPSLFEGRETPKQKLARVASEVLTWPRYLRITSAAKVARRGR